MNATRWHAKFHDLPCQIVTNGDDCIGAAQGNTGPLANGSVCTRCPEHVTSMHLDHDRQLDLAGQVHRGPCIGICPGGQYDVRMKLTYGSIERTSNRFPIAVSLPATQN